MRLLVFVGWVAVLGVIFWPFLKRWLLGQPALRRVLKDQLVKDPVCETYVLRSRALNRTVRGTTFYFCSRECAGRYTGLREGT